ncbi:hypothetical protein [Brevibacillus dissolubilis]|uniref:hypothetical protein n=1 Tax=Brevibacillus dissolubilis TaxID=1844116 RepID=UPI001115DF23|nr:hypothetical protein [Brevibacillus dissolubilis]
MENAFEPQKLKVQEVNLNEEWPLGAVQEDEVSGEETNNKVEQLTRTAADFMVLNIFRKHGVTKDKINRITKEEKQELQQMMQNLQDQVKSLYATPAPKHGTVSAEDTATTPAKKRTAKSKSRIKASRRRNSANNKRNPGR